MAPRTLRIALVLTGLGGLAAGVLIALRGDRPRSPDILFVVWDTCRADRLSTFGYGRATSPRLDALAARGVRFTQCITTAPWTGPAHGSMFTGLLPSVHGMNMVARRVRPDVPVLAELLLDAGYETACFTANPLLSDTTGLTRGFETVVPFFDAARGVKGADPGVEAVRAWLTARRGRDERRPLFLFVNFMDTHVPLEPPQAFVDAVAGGAVPAEAVTAARSLGQVEVMGHLLGVRPIAPETLAGMGVLYDGAVRFVDDRTGTLVDMFEGATEGSDALVVVTSDHGENLGEHGQTEHRASLYEPVLHVPLVIHRRGRFEGGRTVDAQVSLLDLFPTVLREAGVKPPPAPPAEDRIGVHPGRSGGPGGFTGRPLPVAAEAPRSREVFAEQDSFREIIEGQRRKAFPDAPAAKFLPMRTALEAVREPREAPGARKLIRFLPFAEDGQPLPAREELYDLRADPGETRDLLGPDGDPAERDAARRLAGSIDGR